MTDDPPDRQDRFRELADKLQGKHGLDLGSEPDSSGDTALTGEAPRDGGAGWRGPHRLPRLPG